VGSFLPPHDNKAGYLNGKRRGSMAWTQECALKAGFVVMVFKTWVRLPLLCVLVLCREQFLVRWKCAAAQLCCCSCHPHLPVLLSQAHPNTHLHTHTHTHTHTYTHTGTLTTSVCVLSATSTALTCCPIWPTSQVGVCVCVCMLYVSECVLLACKKVFEHTCFVFMCMCACPMILLVVRLLLTAAGTRFPITLGFLIRLSDQAFESTWACKCPYNYGHYFLGCTALLETCLQPCLSPLH